LELKGKGQKELLAKIKSKIFFFNPFSEEKKGIMMIELNTFKLWLSPRRGQLQASEIGYQHSLHVYAVIKSFW
jgi:aminopeptidase C